MATLPDSQSTDLSQRTTTAPSNDLSVEIIIDTQTGGMHGDAAGSVDANNRKTEDK